MRPRGSVSDMSHWEKALKQIQDLLERLHLLGCECLGVPSGIAGGGGGKGLGISVSTVPPANWFWLSGRKWIDGCYYVGLMHKLHNSENKHFKC